MRQNNNDRPEVNPYGDLEPYTTAELKRWLAANPPGPEPKADSQYLDSIDYYAHARVHSIVDAREAEANGHNARGRQLRAAAEIALNQLKMLFDEMFGSGKASA
jgi:hypothetical protein